MYRAADIFKVDRAVVVTQKYHEYRALYIAKKLGIQVCGVASDQESYFGQHIPGGKGDSGQRQRLC